MSRWAREHPEDDWDDYLARAEASYEAERDRKFDPMYELDQPGPEEDDDER